MLKLIAVIFLSVAASVSSAADLSATWNILGMQVGNANYTSMELDITVGARYLAVNGSVIADSGDISLATGTCVLTDQGGVNCNLQVDQNSYAVKLQPDLGGVVVVTAPTGFDIGVSIILLESIQ